MANSTLPLRITEFDYLSAFWALPAGGATFVEGSVIEWFTVPSKEDAALVVWYVRRSSRGPGASYWRLLAPVDLNPVELVDRLSKAFEQSR